MKATAETIREAAANKLLDAYGEDGGSLQLVDAVISTLPITLDQLAGIANGELVLANRDDLIIPAALRGDPDKVSKAHTAWIAASPEKDKTT